MKLLVIGATRGIGAKLAGQALGSGHDITVLARNPEKIEARVGDIRVVKGDIMDKGSVEMAVAGQDAVCITIGVGPTFKPVTVFSEGTKNVLDAMKLHNVKKLVCVTGIGAGDSKNHGGFLYDKIIFPIFLKTIYRDKEIQELIIRQSLLEWLIVRPGFLTNGPVTGKYMVLTDLTGVTCGNISRGDVARFILGELETAEHFGQSPLLTY